VRSVSMGGGKRPRVEAFGGDFSQAQGGDYSQYLGGNLISA